MHPVRLQVLSTLCHRDCQCGMQAYRQHQHIVGDLKHVSFSSLAMQGLAVPLQGSRSLDRWLSPLQLLLVLEFYFRLPPSHLLPLILAGQHSCMWVDVYASGLIVRPLQGRQHYKEAPQRQRKCRGGSSSSCCSRGMQATAAISMQMHCLPALQASLLRWLAPCPG